VLPCDVESPEPLAHATSHDCKLLYLMVNDGKRAATMSDHPHDHRRLAEGALAGVCAAELVRSHRKKEGDECVPRWFLLR
jgi:hypothetical protein